MTRGEQLAVALGVGLVVGVVVWAGPRDFAIDVHGDLAAAADTATSGWTDYDAAHQHLCQPSMMRATVHKRHPLYRRPKQPGHARTMLAWSGWDWFVNPPSEEG